MATNPQSNPPFALLNFPGSTPSRTHSLFDTFDDVLLASEPGDVKPCLDEIGDRARNGSYAVGYISYEAAPALDGALKTNNRNPNVPLVWFGISSRPPSDFPPEPIGVPTGEACGDAGRVSDLSDEFDTEWLRYESGTDRYEISKWIASLPFDEYSELFRKAQQRIRNGDTYQINLTFPLNSVISGSRWGFYRDISRAQPGNYCGWIHTDELDIMSFSPELFFRLDDGVITTRPMKGTCARGITEKSDREFCARLQCSEKDRAENIMIVDLLRNDLGRISEIGSVSVPALFETEVYPTVIQMTSTVRGRLRSEISFTDIVTALFPCGSVTGAPKVKTMELIAEYEVGARDVYCGAIGYLEPGGNAVFNVPIRTAMIDRRGNATCRVGSGLVSDSQARPEYDQCLLKSGFLDQARFVATLSK